MKQFTGYLQKEFLEITRSGKFTILTLLSVLFGIMNPLFAKLTPWLMQLMSEQLSEAGMSVGKVSVDAMTSWMQFYKNIPIELIIFIVIFSGILTTEYLKGTLTIVLTKGLKRWKVIVSKLITMVVMWTFCFWLCYFITYFYNSYFWENSIASHLFFSAFCIYLFGIWICSLIILASTFLKNSYAVLVSAGVIVIISYILGMLPQLSEYLPTYLLSSSSLLTNALTINSFLYSIIIIIILTILNILVSVIFFNKKSV